MTSPTTAGVLIHRYGPHIFHTNSSEVVDYLSRFTEWRPYEHRVLACVRGQLVPIPINRTTVNPLFGLSLQTDDDVAAFFARAREPVERMRTSEDVVVGAVGRELYELFFRGYTRKQWGLDPSQLDASVTARVPTRTNDDDRYFTDRFQLMPADGYTAMFERMLDHPRIEVRTGVDFHDIRRPLDYETLVYTGPVDEFFGHRFGRLPYRSLRFEFETLPQPDVPAGRHRQLSGRDAVPYTRISEFKHMTGPGARRDDDRPRVPAGRPAIPTTRSPAPRTRRSTALPGPRRRDGRRPLRRPAGHVQVLQHGPGRRPGARHVPQDRRGGERSSVIGPSRPGVWAGVEPTHLTIGGRRRDQLVATGHADRLEDIDRIAELGVLGRPLSHPLGLARRPD